MSVENSANNISQLNQNWPTAEDFISEGDDHLRLIKKCVKQTFSKIKEIVNISDKQLNNLATALKDEDNSDLLDFYEGTKIKNDGTIVVKTPNPATNIREDGTVLTVKMLQEMQFPVGGLYLSTIATNPASLLGFGTWAAYAQGRALTGVGSVDGRNITGGATGGSWKKTLSTSHLPPHNHYVNLNTNTTGNHNHSLPTKTNEGGTNNFLARTNDGATSNMNTSDSGNHSHNVQGNTNNTGNGAAFDVDQPYIGIYVWVRVS